MSFTFDFSNITVISCILSFACIMLLFINPLISLWKKAKFIQIPVILLIIGWFVWAFFFAGVRFNLLFIIGIIIFIAILWYLPTLLVKLAFDASKWAMLALIFGCSISFLPFGSQPISGFMGNIGIQLPALPTFNIQAPNIQIPEFQFGSSGPLELTLPNDRVEITGTWNELVLNGRIHLVNVPANTSQFLRLEDSVGETATIYFAGGQEYGSFNLYVNNELRELVTTPVNSGEYVISTGLPDGNWVLLIVPLTGETVAINRIVIQP